MGYFGGKGEHERALTTRETALIRKVFKTARLPSLLTVSIADGVNAQGGYWTDSDYQINVGPTLYEQDLADVYPDLLVHEMVHVWQYYNSGLTKAHAFGAHVLFGALRRSQYLYDYNLGDSWDDMGFEGQAQMVEEWFTSSGVGADKMSTTSLRYIYVEKILHNHDVAARSLTLEEMATRPGPIEIPETYELHVPHQNAQHETLPPLTDDYLIGILKLRYDSNDVRGYAQRVRTLEKVFSAMDRFAAMPLYTRILLRPPGDMVAKYFHDHLATATRKKLLGIIRQRYTGK